MYGMGAGEVSLGSPELSTLSQGLGSHSPVATAVTWWPCLGQKLLLGPLHKWRSLYRHCFCCRGSPRASRGGGRRVNSQPWVGGAAQLMYLQSHQSSGFLRGNGGCQDPSPPLGSIRGGSFAFSCPVLEHRAGSRYPQWDRDWLRRLGRLGQNQTVHSEMSSSASHHLPSRFTIWRLGSNSPRLALLPEVSRGFQKPRCIELWGFCTTSWASTSWSSVGMNGTVWHAEGSPPLYGALALHAALRGGFSRLVILHFPAEGVGSWRLMEGTWWVQQITELVSDLGCPTIPPGAFWLFSGFLGGTSTLLSLNIPCSQLQSPVT